MESAERTLEESFAIINFEILIESGSKEELKDLLIELYKQNLAYKSMVKSLLLQGISR